MKDLTIGVIGCGVVGKATARTYLGFVKEVRVYDQIPERRTTDDLDKVCESDIVFLCLPESNLEWFIEGIPSAYWNTNFVIKSTVPIGTTKRLAKQYKLTNLVHSPEFLTERCAEVDALIPTRNIIGGPPFSGVCCQALEDLYVRRFPGVPILHMNSDASEAVKLITNGFFATKVSYFNEVNELCQKAKLDWNTVLAGVLSDGRIAHSHTQVPGHDGKYGFNGKCLPKDMETLRQCIISNSIIPFMCNAALNRNQIDRERTK